jgi:hypothetical protein
MSEAGKPNYPFFGVAGIELEYPIVDAYLEVRPLVEDLFRRMAGRPTSDVEWGEAEFSNELAASVTPDSISTGATCRTKGKTFISTRQTIGGRVRSWASRRRIFRVAG